MITAVTMYQFNKKKTSKIASQDWLKGCCLLQTKYGLKK